MTRNLKCCLCLALSILMSGCEKVNESSPKKIKETAKYFAVFTDYVSKNCLTEIEFYDQKGQSLKFETIKSSGDLSYHRFVDNNYYMFGPGGLLKIDNEKLVAEKLADGDINDIDVENDDIYIYLNNGYADNGKYDSKIKSISGEFELSLDYHINDMEHHNGLLYTINSLDSQDGKLFINVFDKNKKVNSFEVDENGSFYIINNEVFLLTQSYLLNINSMVKFPLIDEKGAPVSIFSTFDAIHKNVDGYILVNNEVSGSNFYLMELLNENIKLTKIDVQSVGKIKNNIYIENKGFYISNKNNEMFKLTIENGIPDIHEIKVDYKSNKSLFIAYEIDNK